MYCNDFLTKQNINRHCSELGAVAYNQLIMITTEITYNGVSYTCRIVRSNDGEELIIAGTSLLDELMPYEMTDECDGFADKEAKELDEEIFYYTPDCDLRLPDKELIAILKESNPEWFD